MLPTSLNAAMFAGLKLARYRIKLRALEAARLPAFPGSTLRGAFGHALKRAVCIVSHRDCARCLVVSRCVYPYVFETPVPDHLLQLQGQQSAPRPYTLDPPIYRSRIQRNGHAPELPTNEQNLEPELPLDHHPKRPGSPWERYRMLAAGDEIIFGMTLMGRALDYLPYVVFAVHEMTQHGLGTAKARFALVEVTAEDKVGIWQTIYNEATQRLEMPAGEMLSLSDVVNARLALLPPRETLKLHFLTPARIKVDDDLQPRASFDLLVRNLLRRVSLLVAVHGEGTLELDYRKLIARAAEVKVKASALRWWDWQRYSNHQQTRMKMGGFVGPIEYDGEPIAEFMPLIVAGEILRFGKGTSFGLGKYEIADC